jgi:hypothetical protein
MIKTDKKLIRLILLLLISGSASAGLADALTGAISNIATKASGDEYTIFDVEKRLTNIINVYLKNPTRNPSVTIDDLADEFHNNKWSKLALWILDFSNTLLEIDQNQLTDKKIAAIGMRLAQKHLSYARQLQLKAMLDRLKTKFEKDPTLGSIDWYEILKHRRHIINQSNDKSAIVDIDVVEMAVNKNGHQVVTETIDHIKYDKTGLEIEHTHEVTTTELAQK